MKAVSVYLRRPLFFIVAQIVPGRAFLNFALTGILICVARFSEMIASVNL